MGKGVAGSPPHTKTFYRIIGARKRSCKYEKHGTYWKRPIALSVAHNLRNKGYKARVIKWDKVWVVYKSLKGYT